MLRFFFREGLESATKVFGLEWTPPVSENVQRIFLDLSGPPLFPKIHRFYPQKNSNEIFRIGVDPPFSRKFIVFIPPEKTASKFFGSEMP